MNNPIERDRLSASTKFFYLFGDIGVSLCVSAVQFFILFFFADVGRIDPALIGTILLLSKLWDAVNDPLFGWISDRTRSRFGRRKIYLYLFSIPFGISFALLWMIPEGLSGALLIGWLVFVFLLYYTFVTIVSVSYYSMTPELTRDYDERTSLTTVRMIGGTVGYIAGAALPPLMAGLFVTDKIGWQMMGIISGGFTAICLYITAFGVKQRKELEGKPSEMPALRAILTCFKNRPFNYLIIQTGITSTCFVMVTSYMPFFLTYVVNMEKQIPLVMTLLLVTIGAFLFFWKWLTDRWDKGPTYALGLFIAFGATASTFLLPPNASSVWIYAIIFVAGFGFSAQWVLPWALIPDVIEHDELITNERREGTFYGVKGLANKVSEALALFIAGWVLKLFGFIPDAVQTTKSLLGIRLFFGPVPSLLVILSLPLLIWFPITRKSHQETMARLKGRV